MPFRARFDCLWCGRPWETRSGGDLEGWALLCPGCLARANENGFLRMRLRAALRERAAAAPAIDPPAGPADARTAGAPDRAAPADAPRPGTWEDWYLRRGGFARGPIHDGPWSMELEQATRWLDELPLAGVIVELGAGMGWWSGLLAEKGELWLYDADAESLEAARRRLMAHGLLAHLHQRDVMAAPDKQVDAVFAAYLASGAPDARAVGERLGIVRRWLKPGGTFAFVEAGTGEGAAPLAGPAGPLWPRDAASLHEAVSGAGFASVELAPTRSAFLLGRAIAPV